MGELEGRRHPDRPEPTPDDAQRPIRRVEVEYLNKARPAPGPADVLINARTPHDRPKPDVPDGPTHRSPDVDRPSGEDLVDMDAPDATRGDRVRKQLFEEEFISDAHDVLEHVGDAIDDLHAHRPNRPPSAHTEARAPHITPLETPQYGTDLGQTFATLLVGGILLGERARWAYRKFSKAKET